MQRRRATFVVPVVLLELAMFILFGAFVRYDEKLGMPITPSSSSNEVGSDVETEEEVKVAAVDEHISHYYAMFQDIHVMMFIGFGFLMTFLKRYGYSSVGLNFIVAAFVVQWSTLTAGWLREFNDNKIYVNVVNMINAEFSAATILISFGAVLGKVSPIQLMIMAFFEVVFYEVNEMIVFDYLHATDTGDSMVVHTFGAYFGLTVSRIIYKKTTSESEHKETSVYHADLFSMIGTIFLWLYWPSFNGGTAVDEGRLRAVVNTYYSLTASAIITFAISSLVHKSKFNMVHIQNSTLAGGVAIGTLCDFIIQPWGAILVGIVAGTVSVLGYRYLTPILYKYLKIHDTCGVNNLHGMPGLISGLGAILAAGLATEELYGNGLAKIFSETTRSPGLNAAYQAAALVVSLGMAIAGGAITGLILRIPIWNQPDVDEMMDDKGTWLIPEDGYPAEHPGKDSNTSPQLPNLNTYSISGPNGDSMWGTTNANFATSDQL